MRETLDRIEEGLKAADLEQADLARTVSFLAQTLESLGSLLELSDAEFRRSLVFEVGFRGVTFGLPLSLPIESDGELDALAPDVYTSVERLYARTSRLLVEVAERHDSLVRAARFLKPESPLDTPSPVQESATDATHSGG